MGTVPSTTTAIKAERKTPVRKVPMQKDFPNKLAWLKAMTDFETKQEEVTNGAKVSRLNKRIKAKKATIATLNTELSKLEAERVALFPVKAEAATPTS